MTSFNSTIVPRHLHALLGALLVASALPVAPLAAKGVARVDMTPRAGLWRLEGASEGAETCVLRLLAAETIGGRGAAPTGRCTADYRWTGDIMAWHTDPTQGSPRTIILSNAERHMIARFVLADTGEVYTAEVGGEDYSLYPPLPVRPAKRKGHK